MHISGGWLYHIDQVLGECPGAESVQLDRDALDRADSSNTTGSNTTGSSKTDSKTKKPHGETAQQRPETTREPLDVAFRPAATQRHDQWII